MKKLHFLINSSEGVAPGLGYNVDTKGHRRWEYLCVQCDGVQVPLCSPHPQPDPQDRPSMQLRIDVILLMVGPKCYTCTKELKGYCQWWAWRLSRSWKSYPSFTNSSSRSRNTGDWFCYTIKGKDTFVGKTEQDRQLLRCSNGKGYSSGPIACYPQHNLKF